MPAYLHHIETLLPETSYAQEEIAAALKRSVMQGDRRTEKIIHHLYAHSAIERRSRVCYEPASLNGAIVNGGNVT